MRPLFNLLLAGVLGFGTAAWGIEKENGHLMAAPEDLSWSEPASLPGARMAVIEGDLKKQEPYTFRIKFPAGYRVPVHTHPVTERVTVLSGNFHLGIGTTFDETKARALTPGSVAIMEPGVPMFAFTEEETIIQVHGTGPWGVTFLNQGEKQPGSRAR